MRVPVLQHGTAMGHPTWLDNAQTTDWVCWRLGESREVKESSLSNQFGHWYSSPVSGLDWLPSADVHRFQSVTRLIERKHSDPSNKLERKNCLIQKHCLVQGRFGNLKVKLLFITLYSTQVEKHYLLFWCLWYKWGLFTESHKIYHIILIVLNLWCTRRRNKGNYYNTYP